MQLENINHYVMNKLSNGDHQNIIPFREGFKKNKTSRHSRNLEDIRIEIELLE